MSPLADHLLVEAALLGDRRAFELIYRRYGDAVFTFAHEAIGDADDAASVTQDVFTVTWDKLDRVSLASGSLWPWLAGVARGEVANVLRKRARRPLHVDIEEYAGLLVDEVSVSDRVTAHQLLDRLQRRVAEMPPLDARVFECLVTEGLSYEETAARLGISVGNVGKRMNRVRTVLRKARREELG